MTKTPYIDQGSFHDKKLKHLATQDTRVACDVIYVEFLLPLDKPPLSLSQHMCSYLSTANNISFHKPNICLVIMCRRERSYIHFHKKIKVFCCTKEIHVIL
jgi:hypothetical protein